MSVLFFFFKHKTAYEMRISDWSSDVCSSDLPSRSVSKKVSYVGNDGPELIEAVEIPSPSKTRSITSFFKPGSAVKPESTQLLFDAVKRSEEHTSELQSLMRISYAVFTLQKKQIPT